MKMKTKENKAITLIALVVTIILLLILAGTSISMLTGKNGILNRAKEAKEEKEKSQKEENETIKDYEKMLNKNLSNLPSTEYTKPYLPDINKFERMEGTGFSTGLVIREKETGSEYVWVEVPKTTDIYKTAGTNLTSFSENEYKLIENDLANYTGQYKGRAECSDKYYEDSEKGWFENAEQYNELKYRMLKSIYENGGFWVGRYEAGSNVVITKDAEKDNIPVSKPNMYPYNYVTRTQAKGLAEQVEAGSYTSSLIFGIQWNLMLKYIETKNIVSKETLNSNSKSIGNYVNNLWTITNENAKYSINGGASFINMPCTKKEEGPVFLTTGASEKFSLMNIYDIAGNMWEWTLEYTGSSGWPCAQVGGSCFDKGEEFYACFRSCIKLKEFYNNIGFRISIY